MKNLLKITAISLGFASTALAGSPGPAPMVATAAVAAPAQAATDWSGFYVGGLVSFEGGKADAYINDVFFKSSALNNTTAYGVFAGYNMQVNALVFGGEFAYTNGDVGSALYPPARYTDRFDLKARLGFSLGRAMVYGAIGYSFADYYATSGDRHPGAGLNYGAGVEFMVTDRIFVGAEYLARDLSGTGTINPQNRIDSNLSSASIRVGMTF